MTPSMVDAASNAAFASPEALVKAAYQLISFGPGGAPAWSTFRSLFEERSVLAMRVLPHDPSIVVMSLDEYVAKQIWSDTRIAGYEERPIAETFTVTRDMAEARVRFEMIFGSGEVYEAIDVFQMIRRRKRWWIVSIVSDCLDTRVAAVSRS